MPEPLLLSADAEAPQRTYRNHTPGNLLYVSPTKRKCADCGATKDVAAFTVANDKANLRTVCKVCERAADIEKSQAEATKAFRDAINTRHQPRFVGGDNAPASRKSAASFFGRLQYHVQKAGIADTADGESAFGVMLADYFFKAVTEAVDENGEKNTPFLRLKCFAAIQRQMSDLLRHDAQTVDLSHLDTEELRYLLTPFMLDWFRDNPDQFQKLLDDLPSHELAALSQESDE